MAMADNLLSTTFRTIALKINFTSVPQRGSGCKFAKERITSSQRFYTAVVAVAGAIQPNDLHLGVSFLKSTLVFYQIRNDGMIAAG